MLIKKASTLAEELHKPIRRKFKKRRVLVNGIDKIWAADLVDMQAFSKLNRGFKYLLIVIDVFSKYGWLIPLKDKTGKSVASALKTISKKENELTVWRNLYPEHLEIRDINPKFSVGDKVRISKKKKTFEKGYTTRWTEEID